MPLFNKFILGFMRFFGVLAIFVGSYFFYQNFGILFDSEATVTVNGVPTSELPAKIGVVVFILFVVAIGLFLAFSPKTRLESIFIPKFIRGKE